MWDAHASNCQAEIIAVAGHDQLTCSLVGNKVTAYQHANIYNSQRFFEQCNFFKQVIKKYENHGAS